MSYLRLFRTLFLFMIVGNIYAASYLPGQEPYRLVYGMDPAGATVELDDRAVWRVEGEDSRYNVRYWLPQDPIVIYPVMCTCFTGTRFFMYNQRTKTSANAEISLGPVIGGPCNNRIIYIDYMYGEVRLQDGQGGVSVWIAEPNDLYVIQNWRLYQSVILGSNNTWPANWASRCHHILINVENNSYIRGELY